MHIAFYIICVKLIWMLKIRLQRIGRKNDPAFRAVLTDSKNSTKSGKFLEILGTYNPKISKENRTNFKSDRIKHWLSKGAQLSDTMHNFLVRDGVIQGKKINVLPKKTPTKSRKEVKAGPKEEVKEEPKVEAAQPPVAEKKETKPDSTSSPQAEPEVAPALPIPSEQKSDTESSILDLPTESDNSGQIGTAEPKVESKPEASEPPASKVAEPDPSTDSGSPATSSTETKS